MNTKQREKFNDLFRPLENRIKLIMNSGSLLSGLTLALAAFIISMHLSAGYHIIARIIPAILISAVVAFVVEGSIRLLTPVFIKQVFGWDFHNRWFVGMFSIILIMLMGCYAVSGIFSVIGSRHLVSIVSKLPEGKDVQSVASPFDAEMDKVRADFKSHKSAIIKSSADQVKSIEKKYDEQIRNKLKQAKQLKTDGKPGHNWLITSVIPKLKKAKHEKVEAVNAEKSRQIAKLTESHQRATESISEQKSMIVSSTVKENTHGLTVARNRINQAGYGLAILTVLGLVSFFICCGIIVLIRMGGMQGSPPAPKIIPVSNTETRDRDRTETDQNSRNNVQTSVPAVSCGDFMGGRPMTRSQLNNYYKKYYSRSVKYANEGKDEKATEAGKKADMLMEALQTLKNKS